MLAFLLDAIIQLQRRGTTSAAAAASWIRGDEGMTDAAITFRSVCEALGLDADQLARGLLRGSESTPTTPPARARSLHALPPRARRTARPSPLRAGGVALLPVMLLLHALVLAPWWLRLAIVGMVPVAIVALSRVALP